MACLLPFTTLIKIYTWHNKKTSITPIKKTLEYGKPQTTHTKNYTWSMVKWKKGEEEK